MCVCGCVIVGLCVIVGACGRKTGTTFTFYADRIKKVMTSSELVLATAQMIVQKGYEGGITQKVI